ncbi:unnamed protein product [Sphagnum tenellum]
MRVRMLSRSFRHGPKMRTSGGEGGEKYIAKRLWPEQEARPPTTDTLTVIFFHGLQMLDGTDTSETTWKNRSGTVCWPQVWLPEDLGKERVRVLSMSYDSIASCWGIPGQTENLRAIGSDLVEKFITMSGWKLYQNQKIVLVGHSFGGLVIKSLVLEASSRAKKIDNARDKLEKKNSSNCKNFLENIKGIVFYGVPHSGTSIAQYLKDFDRAFPKVQPGDLIRNLQPFQNDMEQLSVDFEEAVNRDIIIYAFAEQLKYNKVLVVPWASATQLSRNHNMSLDANHIDICKPHSKNDEGYMKLVGILELIMEG